MGSCSILVATAAMLAFGAALPASAGSYRVLHNFQGGQDGDHPAATMIKVGGSLYGTTWGGGKHDQGTVFALNPATGAEKVVYAFKGSPDGASPYAGVIEVAGVLYGTTEVGGTSNLGTVFAIDLKTGAETVTHSFDAGALGYHPVGGLTEFLGSDTGRITATLTC